MKTGMILCAAAIAFGLVGCNHDLKNYVDQKIDLKIEQARPTESGLVASGNIKFVHTRYFTNYRTVCDTEICGHHDEQVCSSYPVCHPVGTPVCRGQGSDQTCTGGGDEHDVCHEEQECDIESVPDYCQVNCRQEPFTDSDDTVTESPVTVTLNAEDGSAIDPKDIGQIQLGVNTNAEFQTEMTDPSKRPDDLRGLFDDLDAQDRTLLFVRAKNLKLLPSSTLLTLPEGFKPGDAAHLSATLERSGGKKALSIVGTTVSFPELHTYSQ